MPLTNTESWISDSFLNFQTKYSFGFFVTKNTLCKDWLIRISFGQRIKTTTCKLGNFLKIVTQFLF